MRGNHTQIGRSDYTPPKPLGPEDRSLVQSCTLIKRQGTHLWQDVYLNGELIGGVALRLGGQIYQPLGLARGDYRYAATDWNRSDPHLASAIVALIRHHTNASALEPA